MNDEVWRHSLHMFGDMFCTETVELHRRKLGRSCLRPERPIQFGQPERIWMIGCQHDVPRSVTCQRLIYYVSAVDLLSVSGCSIKRSEARRVGKECVCTCRSGWARDHEKK